MLRFPGIILGVVLFGLTGGVVALCGSVVAGASLAGAMLAYSSCGTLSALAFVAVTNRNLWGA
jgi:hypothetical protein